MASDKDYEVGTAAAVAVEHQIIQEKNIPSFLVPSDADLATYASRVAKAVLDAVDAERATLISEQPQ